MNMFKVKKYIFSNKNVIGLGIASIIVILGFLGILKHGVLGVALIGYIFGWIVGPKEKEIKFYHYKGESMSDYIGFLKKFMKVSFDNEKLPEQAKSILKSIEKNSIELIEYMDKKEMVDSVSEEMMNLKSIFDTYIPNLINQYSRLPVDYANNVKGSNGKTAKDLLVEQLRILEEKIKEIAYGLYENDVTKLKVNGRFLKEKFHSGDFFLNEKSQNE
jgi:hypothetical protein